MFVLRSNKSGFTFHVVLVLLASVVGVVLIGFLTKDQINTNTEKKQFMAAQKEVNSLGQQIAKATNPDKHEAVAYCSYSSAKYGQGTRFCWTKYYLMYLDTDVDNALVKFEEVEKIIAKKQEYTVRDSKYLSSIKNLAFQSPVHPKCGTALYHNENFSPSFGYPSFDEPKNSALVEINCSAEAEAEYFPVKEL